MNALVDIYAKYGSMHKATKLFDRMPERDIISWNSIVAGFAQHGLVEKPLEAFKQLLPAMRTYLMKGHEWVAVSKHTDWMDYYIRKPYNGEKEAPLQLGADGTAYKILFEGPKSSVTDCAI